MRQLRNKTGREISKQGSRQRGKQAVSILKEQDEDEVSEAGLQWVLLLLCLSQRSGVGNLPLLGEYRARPLLSEPGEGKVRN